MRLPNLFATAKGRLIGFFLLYLTEGVPLGFAATAVATQLRRQGVGPAEIGAFVGAFYLPWAFKWAFGPVVDVFTIERWGRRRVWIIGTQLMMMATLISAAWLDLPAQLGLLTAILLVHNTFSAAQDVAIDALAVNLLQESERATANGMMFAGAAIGQLVGGSGALMFISAFGFQSSFFFVAAVIGAVTLLVVLPMVEPASAPRLRAAGSAMAAAGKEMREFALTAFRSFMGTRGAFVALFLALLPPGAMCLGLALQSTLSVELGLDDNAVASINAWSAGLNALGCLLGGRLADRIERRHAMLASVLLMSLPVLALAGVLQHHGWIMPLAANAPQRPTPPEALITLYWVIVMFYNVFQGMVYAATNANFMDVTNPRVAGTQFTAYMALCNLAIATASTWQGIAIEALGYPGTMLLDVLFGLLYLLVMPLTRRRPGGSLADHALAGGRASKLAHALALLCLLWLPVSLLQAHFGAAMEIINIGFTLAFVAAMLFLLAGGMVLGDAQPMLARRARQGAGLLLLMLARNHQETLSQWLAPWFSADTVAAMLAPVFLLVPLVAAWLLWRLSRQDWQALGLAFPAEGADETKAGTEPGNMAAGAAN